MSSSAEKTRSRSPHNKGDEKGASDVSELEVKMLAMWNKTIQPMVEEQNNESQKAIQGLVVGLVSGEVNRIETKVAGLETKVDDGFIEVKKKFSDVNQALERIEKAIATPSAPPPPPGGAPGSGSGSAGDVRSFANVVAASPPLASVPFVANDVNYPLFQP